MIRPIDLGQRRRIGAAAGGLPRRRVVCFNREFDVNWADLPRCEAGIRKVRGWRYENPDQ
jgi:hypothetical protein